MLFLIYTVLIYSAMVKIIQINNNFIKNNDLFTLDISYDHLCSSSIVSQDAHIKKTKISSLFYGSCVIDDQTYFFKSYVNFILIDNFKTIFLCNVSINQITITDNKYKLIIDNPDDFVENIIYDLMKKIFTSSTCSKNKKHNKYFINFNVPIKNNIDNESFYISNLSSSFKIGIFYNNL